MVNLIRGQSIHYALYHKNGKALHFTPHVSCSLTIAAGRHLPYDPYGQVLGWPMRLRLHRISASYGYHFKSSPTSISLIFSTKGHFLRHSLILSYGLAYSVSHTKSKGPAISGKAFAHHNSVIPTVCGNVYRNFSIRQCPLAVQLFRLLLTAANLFVKSVACNENRDLNTPGA